MSKASSLWIYHVAIETLIKRVKGDRTRRAADGGEERAKDNSCGPWRRWRRQGREGTREERRHAVSVVMREVQYSNSYLVCVSSVFNLKNCVICIVRYLSLYLPGCHRFFSQILAFLCGPIAGSKGPKSDGAALAR